MNKRRLVIAAALLLAVILGAFLLNGPGFRTRKIDDILDHYGWKIPASELDEVLLTDGRLTDKSCARIDSALERCEAGSEEALRLAAYALMRTSAGYPEETARQNLTDQIHALDETAYYYDGIFAEIIKEAPWTTQLFYEKYNGVNSYKADRMLQCIAESSRALPLEDRLEMGAGRRSSRFYRGRFPVRGCDRGRPDRPVCTDRGNDRSGTAKSVRTGTGGTG